MSNTSNTSNKSDTSNKSKTNKSNGSNRSNRRAKIKKHYENTTPVFRIRPDGAERGIIKYIGILNEEEKLGDEVVELVTPLHPDHDIVGKHTLPIKSIDSFDMVGHIYRCNIVGAHIVVSRRYPVMYLNIGYDKSMVSGSLFQLFYSIDMNNEDKKNITDNKKYIDLRFEGKWYRHIDCDEELTNNYDSMIIDMLEDEGANIFYKSDDPDIVNKRDTMTDIEITDWIDNYVANERKFYDELIKDTPFSFRTLNKLRDMIVELSQSDRFFKFVQIAMKCREIHRRNEHGMDDESGYVIPKQITKLDTIKQMMIENDELILDD